MQEYRQIGKDLAAKLQGVTDEAKIKQLCNKVYDYISGTTDKPGTFKNRMVAVRNELKAIFPDTDAKEHEYQHFVNYGKGNIPRYEHLAFKYLPTAEKKEADHQLEQPLETEQLIEKQLIKQPIKQVKKQPEVQANQTYTLEDMKIEQLNLDAETQQVVEDAIAHSGMSLAEFIRKACQVYAKTVTGKLNLAKEDLSAVSTSDLLSENYKTHPGRAEELTRRAIYALEVHNNNCTERKEKWHINQTAIQTLTGSKPATIKKILESYQIRLDDHNTKHDLNPYDNRKAWIKIDEAINLIELVPDGLNVV
jgi:hypothetical protein